MLNNRFFYYTKKEITITITITLYLLVLIFIKINIKNQLDIILHIFVWNTDFI